MPVSSHLQSDPADLYLTLFIDHRRQTDPQAPALGHRVAGVEHQVQQYLLKLGAASPHPVALWLVRDIDLEGHRRRQRLAEQPGRLRHQSPELHRPHLGPRAATEGEQ